MPRRAAAQRAPSRMVRASLKEPLWGVPLSEIASPAAPGRSGGPVRTTRTRQLKCGDAVRLRRKNGLPIRPAYGWGPKDQRLHPQSSGIVRKVLPGGECVVHFGLENATLRVQASEIMVLWERWTGTTPTLKWVPVVEHGLTRPASAPTHRSRHHYQHPAVGQDENEGPRQVLLMRPSSARPATTATRHRQRVPAPGGRTMNQVSHLVHKPENQAVLNVARQSVKYADVERLTRLALPVAEQREHNEREASRRQQESDERKALRRLERRIRGRRPRMRPSKPSASPPRVRSKFRREADRGCKYSGGAAMMGSSGDDEAALLLQRLCRRHLTIANAHGGGDADVTGDHIEWQRLEDEAMQRTATLWQEPQAVSPPAPAPAPAPVPAPEPEPAPEPAPTAIEVKIPNEHMRREEMDAMEARPLQVGNRARRQPRGKLSRSLDGRSKPLPAAALYSTKKHLNSGGGTASTARPAQSEAAKLAAKRADARQKAWKKEEQRKRDSCEEQMNVDAQNALRARTVARASKGEPGGGKRHLRSSVPHTRAVNLRGDHTRRKPAVSQAGDTPEDSSAPNPASLAREIAVPASGERTGAMGAATSDAASSRTPPAPRADGPATACAQTAEQTQRPCPVVGAKDKKDEEAGAAAPAAVAPFTSSADVTDGIVAPTRPDQVADRIVTRNEAPAASAEATVPAEVDPATKLEQEKLARRQADKAARKAKREARLAQRQREEAAAGAVATIAGVQGAVATADPALSADAGSETLLKPTGTAGHDDRRPVATPSEPPRADAGTADGREEVAALTAVSAGAGPAAPAEATVPAEVDPATKLEQEKLARRQADKAARKAKREARLAQRQREEAAAGAGTTIAGGAEAASASADAGAEYFTTDFDDAVAVGVAVESTAGELLSEQEMEELQAPGMDVCFSDDEI